MGDSTRCMCAYKAYFRSPHQWDLAIFIHLGRPQALSLPETMLPWPLYNRDLFFFATTEAAVRTMQCCLWLASMPTPPVLVYQCCPTFLASWLFWNPVSLLEVFWHSLETERQVITISRPIITGASDSITRVACIQSKQFTGAKDVHGNSCPPCPIYCYLHREGISTEKSFTDNAKTPPTTFQNETKSWPIPRYLCPEPSETSKEGPRHKRPPLRPIWRRVPVLVWVVRMAKVSTIKGVRRRLG
jgi:hypothetical protein